MTHRRAAPSRAFPAGLLSLLLVPAVLLSGCSTAPDAVDEPDTAAPTTDPAPATTPAPTTPAEVTFVAVGDSITAWTAPLPQPGTERAGSWVPSALAPPAVFAGGWAVPGALTADMVEHVTPYDADVLVLLGGTNDLSNGVGWADSSDHLERIVETAGVPDVVLSAIPPCDARPEATLAYNADLADLAAQHGWDYVDPWTAVSIDGSFRPGASEDGVHPDLAAAEQAGARLHTALLATAGA